MSRLVFLVLVLLAAVLLVESRRCENLITGEVCDKQCCGKEDDLSMRCQDSCVNVTCSVNDDCGNGCCGSNGKCKGPSSECDTEKVIVIIVVTVVLVLIISGVVTCVLICVCRRRRKQPGMVLLVSQ